ncbi:hypothetical protein GOA53_27020 [Sinorhizobium meliloti]|nr:hypothetical protein [Sinorhizobium meliloti]
MQRWRRRPPLWQSITTIIPFRAPSQQRPSVRQEGQHPVPQVPRAPLPRRAPPALRSQHHLHHPRQCPLCLVPPERPQRQRHPSSRLRRRRLPCRPRGRSFRRLRRPLPCRYREMAEEAVELARREIAYCETLLAKGGLNVLSETFRDTAEIKAWDHYPTGDVFDPTSGAQWFYHCHPAEEGAEEHGHFHCFLRPQGPQGPIHHLAAVGVDAHGRLLRLFTVNQWVVGDDWLGAEGTIALLPRCDVQMPRPSYLVNRWLTAIFTAYEQQITELIRERDRTLLAHRQPESVEARQDRALEVTSELKLSDR